MKKRLKRSVNERSRMRWKNSKEIPLMLCEIHMSRLLGKVKWNMVCWRIKEESALSDSSVSCLCGECLSVNFISTASVSSTESKEISLTYSNWDLLPPWKSWLKCASASRNLEVLTSLDWPMKLEKNALLLHRRFIKIPWIGLRLF